jgi:hypothetical protein
MGEKYFTCEICEQHKMIVTDNGGLPMNWYQVEILVTNHSGLTACTGVHVCHKCAQQFLYSINGERLLSVSDLLAKLADLQDVDEKDIN